MSRKCRENQFATRHKRQHLTGRELSLMQVSFHQWDGSPRSHRSVAGLAENEVQVWMAPVQFDGMVSSSLESRLSREECEHAGRVRIDGPRAQFITGRHVLRQILGACLNVEAASLSLHRQSRGKPFLDPQRHDGCVRFNLSHSESWVAIALARGHEVGIDIECINSLADWRPLADRIFSPRELEVLRALPASQQPRAFFSGWTRKEACLKATGEGLRDDLPAIEVAMLQDEPPCVLQWPGVSNQWVIQDIPMPPEYAGAVAFETKS